MIESATLDGAMPVTSIDTDEANHLNLGAASNIFATIFRRFAHDDTVCCTSSIRSPGSCAASPCPTRQPAPDAVALAVLTERPHPVAAQSV